MPKHLTHRVVPQFADYETPYCGPCIFFDHPKCLFCHTLKLSQAHRLPLSRLSHLHDGQGRVARREQEGLRVEERRALRGQGPAGLLAERRRVDTRRGAPGASRAQIVCEAAKSAADQPICSTICKKDRIKLRRYIVDILNSSWHRNTH